MYRKSCCTTPGIRRWRGRWHQQSVKGFPLKVFYVMGKAIFVSSPVQKYREAIVVTWPLMWVCVCHTFKVYIKVSYVMGKALSG